MTKWMLHFETKSQLCAFRNFVGGIAGTTGVCDRPPKISQSHGKLLEDNIGVNYILGTNSDEDPYRPHTTKDGIDISFNHGGYLCISLRYRKYLYQVDRDSQPAHCPSPELLDLILYFPSPCAHSSSVSIQQEYELTMEGYNMSCSSDCDDSSHNPLIDSMSSYYKPGFFCLLLAHILYQISSVTCQNVAAVIMNPGESDLLNGESKILGRTTQNSFKASLTTTDRNIR